jgi:hypothetical protein
MSRAFTNWLFKPVTVDGFLWVCIALFGTMQTMLTNDDAYKYVNPVALFWLKFVCGCGAACALALNSFRSKTFANHLSENPTPKDTPRTP